MLAAYAVSETAVFTQVARWKDAICLRNGLTFGLWPRLVEENRVPSFLEHFLLEEKTRKPFWAFQKLLSSLIIL